MAKKRKLCANCRTTRDNATVRQPPHVVHPISRKPQLYDTHGHADCPDCGARWHRGPRGIELVA